MPATSETINLDSTLCIDRVDAAELTWVLLLHFGHSSLGHSSNEVAFCRGGEQSAVKLIYKKSELVSAIGGPALTPGDIASLGDKVRRELMNGSGAVISRCILLSSKRITGSFAHKEKLRILPVPEQAPKAPDLTDDEYYGDRVAIEHPFIVVFPINRSPNSAVQFERLKRQTRKYSLLLNLFLNDTIKRASSGQQRHWVHEEEASLSTGYKYLRGGYRYPGFADIGPDVLPIGSHPLTFSRLDDIAPMIAIEYGEYFLYPYEGRNLTMTVPVLLATFFDRFECLDKSDQERYLRAALWFYQASTLSAEFKSAAFLAIISCIETLRTVIPPTAKCEKCGSLRGKGAARQFVEFLHDLVPATEDEKKTREELYRLRSALIHGGDVFHSDVEATKRMNPKAISELSSYSIALNMARRALLSWLMRRTGGWPPSN
jgi:hypothetical protein